MDGWLASSCSGGQEYWIPAKSRCDKATCLGKLGLRPLVNSKIMTMDDEVVYGVDIGVYHVTHQGEPKSSTTFAWCRLANLEESSTERSQKGKSLAELAENIRSDLDSQRRIALGFEAPMWLPAGRVETLVEHPVFEPRFGAEKQPYLWYAQAGAAASIKALVLGSMLFEEIGPERLTKTTTQIETWREDSGILLYEGFVVGERRHATESNESQDELDARAVATAFFDTSIGSDGQRSEVLHAAGDAKRAFSVWNSILNFAGEANHSGPCDCQVVAPT